MRGRIWLLAAAGLTVAVAAILIVVLLPPPRSVPPPTWRGEGDWSACASIAPVSPGDAVSTALASHGYAPGAEDRAMIEPLFVNDTGTLFSVTCQGRLSVGEAIGNVWQPYDGGNRFVWRVATADGICVHWDLVDWVSGAIVLAMTAC